MARRIHFSRLLDIISGSAVAGANTKVQRSALYKDFDVAKLESKKLRDLIDSNLPTFYVVNIDTITNEVSAGLGLNSFVENEDYVTSKFPKKEALRSFIHETIKNSLSKIPEKSFLDNYNAILAEYNKLLNSLSNRTSYIGYRNAAARFGANLRTKQKSLGVYRASDGKTILANIGINNILVIGPTFNSAVESVNKFLNSGLREAFKKTYDISLKEYSGDPQNRFTIGDFVNAGHTAAFSEQGKLIGVNAPFAQEKQFVLSGTNLAEGIDAAIAPIYLEAQYDIKFNQNYTTIGQNLLDMQFSFVVTMPAKYNTATLRTQELRKINEYIGNEVLPTVVEQARKKFSGGIVQELLPDIAASPTLVEFIQDAVVSTIKGKKVTNVKKSSKTSSSSQIPFHAIYTKKKKSIVKAKTGGIQISSQTIPIKKSSTSLESLLSMINKDLHDQIKRSMGTGNSRNVLNYRSGRFAKSAKVERLSESRQGMITAFYSYMKNPYATFSAGGKQEFPRTRDPKLLISKSIRELAAEQVRNRLRAVLV